MYGSVKPTEISKLIKEENKIEIKPSMIQPVEEIKSLGKFKVKISLHSEVDAEIKIKVTSADTIQWLYIFFPKANLGFYLKFKSINSLLWKII